MRPHVIELIEKQQNTFVNLFKKNPSFHRDIHHFDWWMFPLEAPRNANVTPMTRHFSIDVQDTQDLLQHDKFINTYLLSIEKYLANLKRYGWNHYPVRFAKMLLSLDQFIKVSDRLVSDPKIKAINEKLKQLANRALDYAAHEIRDVTPLFNSGMRYLTQTLYATHSRKKPQQVQAQTPPAMINMPRTPRSPAGIIRPIPITTAITTGHPITQQTPTPIRTSRLSNTKGTTLFKKR